MKPISKQFPNIGVLQQTHDQTHNHLRFSVWLDLSLTTRNPIIHIKDAINSQIPWHR